jgi:hypothetical protein
VKPESKGHLGELLADRSDNVELNRAWLSTSPRWCIGTFFSLSAVAGTALYYQSEAQRHVEYYFLGSVTGISAFAAFVVPLLMRHLWAKKSIAPFEAPVVLAGDALHEASIFRIFWEYFKVFYMRVTRPARLFRYMNHELMVRGCKNRIIVSVAKVMWYVGLAVPPFSAWLMFGVEQRKKEILSAQPSPIRSGNER